MSTAPQPLPEDLSLPTGDEMVTIAAPKPTAAPLPDASVMGANPDSPVPFVFGKRIAQGGMGAILEGDDCKLGRKIAVKVMLDPAASADQTQRFVQEAAVLGRLEHPNIVPIHDLGRDSEGALYYTMKLVKGRTLQAVIDDLRKGEQEALRHFTLDRLLTIFRKVCDALAFAHANSIIHRDLKPENVMVGEFGEVLVMDWGIAKIMGESIVDGAVDHPPSADSDPNIARETPHFSTASFTATMDGAVMGTPNYMCPEQAMGRINELDERSDVFSLGGILYAILTLRPPVEGKDVWEVLEKVQTASITAPTAFGATSTSKTRPGAKGAVLKAKKLAPLPHMPGGRVPSALSSVAMKALALDKAKRYQDVAAFSADIEAYQGGFATNAENAGVVKQLALLIKRNKGIFATAAAAWLLVTGLAVVFVLNLRAKEQRAVEAEKRATNTLAEVAAQRDAKEQARKEAEAISDFLTGVFQSPDPTRDGRTITVAETLDRAVGKLETELVDQPERRVALQSTLAGTYLALGLYREAIPLLEQIRDHRRAALGPEHVDTLAAMYLLARATFHAGHWPEALKMREEVLEMQQKVLGPEHPDTLATMHELAFSYHKAGNGKKAIELLEQVLTLRRNVLGGEHPGTLATMHTLGDIYQRYGRRKEGFELFEKTLELRQKVLGPEHPDTLMTMHYLALTYRMFWDATMGPSHWELAPIKLQEVFELRKKVLGPEHPDTLMTMFYLSHHRGGPQGLKMQEDLLQLRLKALGPKHHDTLLAMIQLGNTYRKQGRLDEALKLHEELLPLRREVSGDKHSTTIDAMKALAETYRAIGKPEKAAALELQFQKPGR